MELTNINNTYDIKDKPVYLSNDEIEIILNHLPNTYGSDLKENENIRNSLRHYFQDILQNKKVSPSAINNVTNEIVKQHGQSRIAAGQSVGSHCAESCSQPAMQQTLNSVISTEKLLIQDEDGSGHIYEIGTWIDQLLIENPDKIELFPKNRTQYLGLDEPVYIASCNDEGIMSWDKVTGITKHLPKGDLVKIKTKSGREVTATQNKSLLVWNGINIVPIKGKDIKVGDQVPISNQIPTSHKVYHEVNLNKKFKLDKQFGQIVGLYYAVGDNKSDEDDKANNVTFCVEEFDIVKLIGEWCYRMNFEIYREYNKKCTIIKIDSVLFSESFKKWTSTIPVEDGLSVPQEILFGNNEFIKGFLNGYFSGIGTIDKYINMDTKNLTETIAYLCSRFGIFCNINDNKIIIKNVTLWRQLIGTCDVEKYKLMCNQSKSYKNVYNDVMLDPIISIEYVRDIEFVYDLTVPSTLNFSLFNGLNLRDSFHSAGQSRSSGGISEMEELFYAKKVRKTELCTIYYKDRLSYEEVLDSKKDIEGCMMSQFIQDYLYVKEGERYVKKYEIETYDNLSKKWWHNNDYYLNNILKTKIPNDDDYVLRIHLNLKEMYKYKVSIQDMVDVFNREIDSPINLLYGPMQDAIIDIYACADFVENKKKEMVLEGVACSDNNNTMATAAFYQSILMPSLNTLKIKGVSGITNLVPIVTPVISAILSDDKVVWKLTYNNDKTINNIIKMFQLFSIFIVKQTDDYLLLTMPKYEDIAYFFVGDSSMTKEKYLALTPIVYADLIIKIDKKNNPKNKQNNLLKTFSNLKVLTIEKLYSVVLSHKKMNQSGISIQMIKKLFKKSGVEIALEEDEFNPKLYVISASSPRSVISALLKNDESLKKYAELIHAEVIGSNLRGLLALPFLDKTRVKSNNMHVTAAVLGNRAARKLFIDECIESTTPFGVHPQHIILIADVYFSRGVPTGAMYNSVNKQLGPVDKATVSKAVDVFKASSLHGITNDITGVSTHIAFGIAPKIGTGYFDVAYHGKKVSVNSEMYTAFKNEQAYIDREANQIMPVDITMPEIESEEYLPLTSRPVLLGKKVNLPYEEPVIIENIPTKPVSRYQKSKTIEIEPVKPVSRYQKAKTIDIEPSKPVSRYQKSKLIEEKEEKIEEKEPLKPVSRYQKKKEEKIEEKIEEKEPVKKTIPIKKSDISAKSKRTKK